MGFLQGWNIFVFYELRLGCSYPDIVGPFSGLRNHQLWNPFGPFMWVWDLGLCFTLPLFPQIIVPVNSRGEEMESIDLLKGYFDWSIIKVGPLLSIFKTYMMPLEKLIQ